MPDSFQSAIPFPAFFASTVATSVVIGCVVDATEGSVLLLALARAAADAPPGVSGVMTSGPVPRFGAATARNVAVAGRELRHLPATAGISPTRRRLYRM